MGKQREAKPDQERVLDPDDKVLGQARIEPDGTTSPHTWGEKVKEKAEAKDIRYLTGWLKVRFKNDRKKIQEALNEYQPQRTSTPKNPRVDNKASKSKQKVSRKKA